MQPRKVEESIVCDDMLKRKINEIIWKHEIRKNTYVRI